MWHGGLILHGGTEIAGPFYCEKYDHNIINSGLIMQNDIDSNNCDFVKKIILLVYLFAISDP